MFLSIGSWTTSHIDIDTKGLNVFFFSLSTFSNSLTAFFSLSPPSSPLFLLTTLSLFYSILPCFLFSVAGPHLWSVVCAVSSNQSSAHEYPDCRDGGSEASLLVSPLVVAGIVIGLVLFLSCVTIIVGSLRKDSRLRNPHLRASYGELQSVVHR